MFEEITNTLKQIKIDDSKIIEYEKQNQLQLQQERLYILQKTTPVEFQDADIKKIDSRIIEFLKSNKIFCWISGVKGAGKSWSLYALRNSKIMQGQKFEIKMEHEIFWDSEKNNMNCDYRYINAIDNIEIENSQPKSLIKFYFSIIDWCWKNHKKLFFTASVDCKKWLDMVGRINVDHAESIASRFSKNIEFIELQNIDRRKNK